MTGRLDPQVIAGRKAEVEDIEGHNNEQIG
jgi:hypothetical protein